ncbi:MAG: hypothetical protein IH626_16770 [Rhodospirillales bacterium]|nr:hypothetical protein [Rhodospirillales bacterium]
MAEDDDRDDGGETPQDVIQQLQTTGFFEQIRDLDANIKRIVGDLETLGALATERLRETENLAAHLLAVEAILAVILKTHPVDPEAVRSAIKQMTAELTGDPDGSPAVRSVVDTLLSGIKPKD